MEPTIRLNPARTYSLLGVLFTVIVGVSLGIVAFAIPGPLLNLFFALAVVALFLALLAYMTTAERMRRGTLTEGLAAKGPCLGFGVVMLIFGAAFGVIFGGFLINLTLLVALTAFAASIFFILAHASIQVERAVVAGQPPQPQPIVMGETPIEGPPSYGGSGPSVGPALAYLECRQGADAGRSFPLTSYVTTIGRGDPTRWHPAPGDVVLTDRSVSRPHSKLFFESGAWYITDLNSANGTYVDGTAALPDPERRAVQDGSQIGLGPRAILGFRRGASRGETEVTRRT